MSVKKRPDGQWRARYRDAAGKEHAKHFARKTDAEAWEQAQRTSVRRGTHVDPQAGRVLVRDYAATWQAAQIQHRPTTASLADITMRVHTLPEIGDLRMVAVGRTNIQNLISKWAETAKASTVHSRFTHLRALFNSAVDDGLIARSPCQRIKLPEVIKEKVAPLSVDQVLALHAKIEPAFRPAILVGAGCGLRVREVLGITKPAVKFLERSIDVRWQISDKPPWTLVPLKTKNSYREVPAPTFVLDALSVLEPGAVLETLFVRTTAAGQPISARMVHKAVANAVSAVNSAALERKKERKAGLTSDPELPSIPAGTTFHDLRHHYASLLIDGGESVTVVAERLGNTPQETLDTYSHLWPDSTDRTRRIVDAAWGGRESADEVRTPILKSGS